MGASNEVVVVEDDRNVAKLIALALERQGIKVRHADTISAARGLLRRPWDLALLDRGLPDGDGIDLCHEIRPTNPHGYIIILTGESTNEAKLAGFECGADDYITKPFAIEELVARARAGLRIVELQKALLASNRRLEELSLTDPLTGLANRRAFEAELAERFELARRYGRPLALAMIDVDKFKKINDAYGHPVGDAVLRRIAEVLRRETRQTDVAARFGGEEFVVLLPQAELLEALQFADKIRAAVAAENMGDGLPPRVTISIGVASTGQSHFATPADLLRAADDALYRAKERGRNRVEGERRSVAA